MVVSQFRLQYTMQKIQCHKPFCRLMIQYLNVYSWYGLILVYHMTGWCLNVDLKLFFCGFTTHGKHQGGHSCPKPGFQAADADEDLQVG